MERPWLYLSFAFLQLCNRPLVGNKGSDNGSRKKSEKPRPRQDLWRIRSSPIPRCNNNSYTYRSWLYLIYSLNLPFPSLSAYYFPGHYSLIIRWSTVKLQRLCAFSRASSSSSSFLESTRVISLGTSGTRTSKIVP